MFCVVGSVFQRSDVAVAIAVACSASFLQGCDAHNACIGALELSGWSTAPLLGVDCFCVWFGCI